MFISVFSSTLKVESEKVDLSLVEKNRSTNKSLERSLRLCFLQKEKSLEDLGPLRESSIDRYLMHRVSSESSLEGSFEEIREAVERSEESMLDNTPRVEVY